MMGLRHVTRCLCVLILSTVILRGELAAQGTPEAGPSVDGLLQEALALEKSGDFAGAAAMLARVLDDEPTSVQALLAYERVLRLQGRVDGTLEAVARLLEAEPASALGHQIRVRLLAELERDAELEIALEDWMNATPKLETPYREAARIWQERGELKRAFQVLEEGRSRLGRDEALGLEMGEVALLLGDIPRAVREWDMAIGEDARGYTLVRRRLASYPDGGARVVPGLIEALTKKGSSAARQRVAVELAIGAGLGAKAERISREVLKALPSPARQGFLVEVARRADGARLPALAYWAYGALLDERIEQPLAVRGRLGALALELGDTAAARSHFQVLERAAEPGSEERREAVVVRIELTAQRGEVAEASSALRRFREEYPEAPELDHLAATLAELLLERGEPEEAEGVLLGVTGPRSKMMYGRIALYTGDPATARSAFLQAAVQLPGAEATEAIALATLLKRLGPAGGELLARGLRLVAADSVAEGVALLADGEAELERRERVALLEYGAGLADRARLGAEAERIRRMIATDFADTPEAAAALLALGRALAAGQDTRAEARSYLERLIKEHPRSALVPQARRELDRLDGHVQERGAD